MPLDGSIKKFYPFVGLKFSGDSVKIMSQDSDKDKEKDSQIKKKGLFSLF